MSLRDAVSNHAAGLMVSLSEHAFERGLGLGTATACTELVEATPGIFRATIHTQIVAQLRRGGGVRTAGVMCQLFVAPSDYVACLDRWFYPHLAEALSGSVWTDMKEEEA